MAQRGSMDQRAAKTTLESLVGESPMRNRLQFTTYIAAIIACYPAEVAKPASNGKPLSHVLWCATNPSQVEWLLNGQRYRHAIASPMERELLASGTTSNESFHAEMRKWFDGMPTIYGPTLELKLSILALAKLWAHNAALYRPTAVQLQQKLVLHRVVAACRLWTDEAWTSWCRDHMSADGHKLTMCMPELALKRQAQKRRVSDHKQAKTAAAVVVHRRPAAADAPTPCVSSTKRMKRTAFTLRRAKHLVRKARGTSKKKPACAAA